MSKRQTAALCALVALSGCAPMIRSPEKLPEPKPEVLQAAEAAAVQASAELLARQEALAAQIERTKPPAEEPVAPMPSRMDQKKVSVAMRNTRIGPLLWLIANEFNLNLAADPAVTALPATANLYLKNVTGRQALERILAAFDVHGVVSPDGTLTVKLLEDRMFEVEELINKSQLQVNSGGDIFGSGSAGKQGSSSVRDAVMLNGELGDKGDIAEALKKALEGILGETTATAKDNSPDRPRYVMDATRGALHVNARPSQVRAIDRFIKESEKFYRRQVRIDAQLIDVQLNDSYSLGIDWALLAKNVVGRVGTSAATLEKLTTKGVASLNGREIVIPVQQVGPSAGMGGGLAVYNDHVAAAVNALREFGAVKLLSSPTVRLRNGSPAFLSVGTTIRYVQKVTVNTNVGGGSSSSSTSVETDSVFAGVMIGVSAVVKSDGLIQLFVRPSQSEVQEATLQLVDVGQGNKVTLPRVNAKSLTTTLNLRSGDTVVIGGLIDQQSDNSDAGVPGLGDVPGVGSAFSRDSRNHRTRELVMVLRANVL